VKSLGPLDFSPPCTRSYTVFLTNDPLRVSRKLKDSRVCHAPCVPSALSRLGAGDAPALDPDGPVPANSRSPARHAACIPSALSRLGGRHRAVPSAVPAYARPCQNRAIRATRTSSRRLCCPAVLPRSRFGLHLFDRATPPVIRLTRRLTPRAHHTMPRRQTEIGDRFPAGRMAAPLP